ncbi:ABC transporter substrate-binding protein [Streptacidiphilus fuscans]|uniref:ABC transporter substrate-binding protein n=1 Tax=Streptacidiphilus fuscans TaxID=2789292 RepID=A0A931FHJ2_9ACTN|nr:ABC transporter substrate-binding protein [Streptacidiphilus fuscans]MBF9070729.1 ABC transporter substrate-binding protein [Streptacidiphilus fuscans]
MREASAPRSTLKIGIGAPESFDPAICFDHDGALVLGLLTDTLVTCEPRSGDLRPGAAEEWEVAPDGRRIVLRLRPGVRFHHGRLVTAEDYVYSLSRAVRPSTGSQIAYLLSLVDGFDAVREGRAEVLSGVRTLAADRLEISLSRPFHEIAAVLSHPITAAVPRELCEADPALFRRSPVGTGPYRFSEGSGAGDAVLVLERRDGYYGAGGPERVEFHVLDDADAAYRAWQSGRVDIVEVADGRAEDARQARRARRTEDARHARRARDTYRVTRCASLTYLAFPVQHAPFDDPLVRRAVAMAVDRSRLCEIAGPGDVLPADSVIPPRLLPGGSESSLPGLPFDPEAARRILAGRGVERRPVRIVLDGDRGHDQWVAAAAGQLEANLGWTVKVDALPRADYLRWLQRPDALFRATWVSDYPSVDTVLFPLFHSDAAEAGGNYAGYRSARVDELVDAARATADPVTRLRRYRDAEAVVWAELPILPLWHGTMRHLVAPGPFEVDGDDPIDLFGAPCARLFREVHR